MILLKKNKGAFKLSMKISDYTHRKRPGRPRSKKSHRAILSATREILIESGVHGLTIEGVAAKAKVGKTTIYRHWQSKEDLIAEAFGSIADEIDIPDTGNAINDLTTVLNDMVEVATNVTRSTTAFKRILASLVESPALMNVYKNQFILPRRDALKQIIEKGIKLGQIREDIQIDSLIDIVAGSYFYTVMVNDDQISAREWLRKIKPIIMEGIAPKE